MAMGKRKSEQAPMWVPTTDLPVSPGHPFYARLNAVLDEAGFGRFGEEQCRPFYAPVMGEAHRWLVEEVLERAAHGARIAQRLGDQRQRSRGRERIGVQKEEHIAARGGSAGVHELGPRRAAGPDEPGLVANGVCRRLPIARPGDADLAPADPRHVGSTTERA